MPEYVAQCHVQGDVGDRQAVDSEHHGEVAHAGALCQDFRVSGIRQSGGVQALLVQWGCDDAVGVTCQREIDCGTKKVVCSASGLGVHLARFDE